MCQARVTERGTGLIKLDLNPDFLDMRGLGFHGWQLQSSPGRRNRFWKSPGLGVGGRQNLENIRRFTFCKSVCSLRQFNRLGTVAQRWV